MSSKIFCMQRYQKKNMIYRFFDQLSVEEQRKRSTMCLQYLCDILVDDFYIWLADVQKDFKRKSRCLLGRLLWPDETLEGNIINCSCIVVKEYFFQGL